MRGDDENPHEERERGELRQEDDSSRDRQREQDTEVGFVGKQRMADQQGGEGDHQHRKRDDERFDRGPRTRAGVSDSATRLETALHQHPSSSSPNVSIAATTPIKTR